MSEHILASDLPALPGVMDQAISEVTARHLTFENFLKLFDEEVHGRLRELALRPGATHLVALDNLQIDSSHWGERTAMLAGDPALADASTPGEGPTLERVLGTPYFHLGSVPSLFQYPVAYASVAAVRGEFDRAQDFVCTEDRPERPRSDDPAPQATPVATQDAAGQPAADPEARSPT